MSAGRIDRPGARRTQASIEQVLASSPAFHSLDAPARRELTQSLSKIAGFLQDDNDPLAYQMAPDLRQALAPNASGGSGPTAPAPGTPAPAPGQPAPSGGGSPTARVGEVARATLSAIDFPAFVGSLIQGTFQAIVDASIQQMEAYANLLKNVATTVDTFMTDNITDGSARDYLADQYGGVFARDTSGGGPRLVLNRDTRGQQTELPSFFKDLGFDSLNSIDDQAVEEVVVPAARRHLAESRQRTLATMVLMGINRVVVDDGEIMAKLQFHIDASEAMTMRFDQTKTTAGTMSGNAGRSPFSAQAIMVNTASLNAQSEINVRADLTGQVKVKFRSETFPLERFADSAAIQLINSNARVPQAAPAPGAPAAAPAPTPPAAAAPAARPAGPPPLPPVTAPVAPAQGLAEPDPWAPEF
jgi:hypothetical protein